MTCGTVNDTKPTTPATTSEKKITTGTQRAEKRFSIFPTMLVAM
jgi:hypothetical protein